MATTVNRMFMARRHRARRTWPQRLVLAFSLVVVASAIFSAVLLVYARGTVASIPRVIIPGSPSEVESTGTGPLDEEGSLEPSLNFLLVGVDSLVGLPSDHILRSTRPAGNLLTDTLIVMRVNPNAGVAAALSIPRDLWVPIAGAGREDKINAALALGGQETLVRTIQEYLDIPIHRYIQVDFNGFLELVDVIDGVNVLLEYPLWDEKAQFFIDEVGCVNLSADQALSYVRARNLLASINGSWVRVDSRGDLGRVDRQQDFLVLAINRALSKGLTNPATAKGLLDNVLGGGFVTLDSVITPDELMDLAQDFRTFDDDSLTRYSLPVESGSAGNLSVLRLIESEAEGVLSVFRGDGDSEKPATRVAIRNGTGAPGLAGEVKDVLQSVGFNVVETSNADRFTYEASTIVYDSTQSAQAVELQKWLRNGAFLQERSADTGVVLELIVGSDYAGIAENTEEMYSEPGGDQLGSEPAQVSSNGSPASDASPTPTPTPTPQPIATIRGC